MTYNFDRHGFDYGIMEKWEIQETYIPALRLLLEIKKGYS